MEIVRVDDEEIQGWIDEEVENLADDLLKEMKDTVHVDTGNLRDSLTKEKLEVGYSVGVDGNLVERKNGFDYSVPYYYGKGTWAGHKFLEESMNRVK